MVFYHAILTCLHASSKEILHAPFTKKNQNLLVNVLSIPLTGIMFIFGISLLFPWLIFKLVIKTYLKFRYFNSFGGILDMDSSLEYEKLEITEVYILEHDGSFEELFCNVKQACERFHNSHFKFSSIVQKCAGFYYYLKNKVTINDVILVVDEECATKNQLLDYLEENHLNESDSRIKLWEVKVLRKPIIWSNDNKVYHPIIIRYHHCLADFICMSVFQQKYLFNDVVVKNFRNGLSKSKRPKEVLKQSSALELTLNILRLDSLRMQSDINSNHLGLHVEDEPRYLELIKLLSKHFECTFTDILMLSCVSSIVDYLKPKYILPEGIIVGNTCRPITEDISALLNAKLFRNNMTLEMIKLFREGDDNFYSNFNKWLEILKQERRNGNFQIFYIVRNLLTNFPVFATAHIQPKVSSKVLFGLSNIPGPDSVKIGNNAVKDIFMISNHSAGGKIVMFARSYAGKLQLTLIPHKNLDITREDLQSILSNTLENIDKMLEMA